MGFPDFLGRDLALRSRLVLEHKRARRLSWRLLTRLLPAGLRCSFPLARVIQTLVCSQATYDYKPCILVFVFESRQI